MKQSPHPFCCKISICSQKNCSAAVALIKECQSWLTALDSQDSIGIWVLLADTSKAFDRVNHATLTLCFCEVILEPWDMAWILSYLHERRQRVKAACHRFTQRLLPHNFCRPSRSGFVPLFMLYMNSRNTFFSDSLSVGYAEKIRLSRSLVIKFPFLDLIMQLEV